MDDISRTKATLFLEAKGIPSPEQIYLKLDKTGLDKIDRLMDGDITSRKFLRKFLMIFLAFGSTVVFFKTLKLTVGYVFGDPSERGSSSTSEKSPFSYLFFNP